MTRILVALSWCETKCRPERFFPCLQVISGIFSTKLLGVGVLIFTKSDLYVGLFFALSQIFVASRTILIITSHWPCPQVETVLREDLAESDHHRILARLGFVASPVELARRSRLVHWRGRERRQEETDSGWGRVSPALGWRR